LNFDAVEFIVSQLLNKVLQYKLVVGERHQVEIEVNELLEEGWELYGSPSMSHGPLPTNSPRISQALIKNE